MVATAVPTAETKPTLALLERLAPIWGPRDFAIRFWDGTVLAPTVGQPAKFTLLLNHPGALRLMLWPFNHANAGEAYIFDDIDIEGDIEEFMSAVMRLYDGAMALPLLRKLGLFRGMLALPNQSKPRAGRPPAQLSGEDRSPNRDKQAIEYHYDGVPSEFYALFLDRYMQYTCGYFDRPDEDIDAAQERKLDYVCRKLRLQPGERLIDFGCGWGGLITFAAKHYGVHAVGVSISKEQIKWAEREIARLGVGDRSRVLYSDYRQVPETEPFDKAVSVGFIEHVGRKMMPTFFGKVWRLLRPGGQYLHHGITQRPFTADPPWAPFTYKYIFPNGELVSIVETQDELTKAGFEIRDVESLREHYTFTLRCWLRKLEANRTEAVRLTDEVNYRIFRIFLGGAIYGFRKAVYNLNQTLVVKAGHDMSGLPLTRAEWYR